MWTQMACDALRQKRRLELTYDSGAAKRFEVHAVGYSAVGRPIMRAWQAAGGGSGRERSGWKLVPLDEAAGAHFTDETSSAPRSGHKRGDRVFDRILCEL